MANKWKMLNADIVGLCTIYRIISVSKIDSGHLFGIVMPSLKLNPEISLRYEITEIQK